MIQVFKKKQNIIQTIDNLLYEGTNSLVETGMNFIRKENPTEDDWNNACKYFRLASKENNFEGMWRYGWCLQSNRGPKLNKIKGESLIHTSACNGSFDAYFFSSKHDLMNVHFQSKLVESKHPGILWEIGVQIQNDNLQKYQHSEFKQSHEYFRLSAETGILSYVEAYIKLLKYKKVPSHNFESDIQYFTSLAKTEQTS